jgi:rhodanese-related sulfurtransferase
MIIAGPFIRIYLCVLLCLWSVSQSCAAWQSPKTVEGTTRINTTEARQHFDHGLPFIDVRSEYYYNKRHIPGAHHLDLKKNFTLENLKKIIGQNDPAVIYCNGAHCSLSYRASSKAVEWGFTSILYYRDGFRAWRKAGNPIEVSESRDQKK